MEKGRISQNCETAPCSAGAGCVCSLNASGRSLIGSSSNAWLEIAQP
jgi:hypothetical protein